MKNTIHRKLTTERGLIELFFSLRGLMLIATFGSMLGALLMFWAGGIHLYHAYETLLGVELEPHGPAEAAAKAGGDQAQVVVYVLEAIDAFLFALVLMIFAYGIALGFVFHHVTDRYRDYLPAWMLVEGVGQLKRTLAEVVIVVMIVIFARIIIESRGNLHWNMLVLPISVVLISLSLKLIHHPDEGGGENSHRPVKSFADDRPAAEGAINASESAAPVKPTPAPAVTATAAEVRRGRQQPKRT